MNLFQNKCYEVKISVHDVTKRILSRDKRPRFQICILYKKQLVVLNIFFGI